MDRSTVRVLALVAVSFVVLLLVASGDVVTVFHEPPPSSSREHRDAQPPAETPVVQQNEPPPADDGRTDLSWITGIAIVLVVILALTIAWSIISTWSGWRPVRPSKLSLSNPIAPLPIVEQPEVVLDEDAQLAALLEGSPRNAIVACWLRMEEDVARAGMPKHPAETSTEYTTRVLSMSSLDPAPVHQLAALYREARFSRHALGQEHRERALAALRQIHASLAQPVAAGEPS